MLISLIKALIPHFKTMTLPVKVGYDKWGAQYFEPVFFEDDFIEGEALVTNAEVDSKIFTWLGFYYNYSNSDLKILNNT